MFVTIFVEGNEDLFLKHLILNLGVSINEDNIYFGMLGEPKSGEIVVNIFKIEGFTKLEKNANSFQQTVDRGGVNLVIFDADDNSKDFGGYHNRMEYLENKKSEFGLSFDTFLFPDNGSDGDFETLLESIVLEKHRPLLGCFDKYVSCIKKIKHEDGTAYNHPVRKSKIYSYVDAIKKSHKDEKRFKDNKKGDFLFDRTDIWDMKSTGIEPLKKFLKDFLKN